MAYTVFDLLDKLQNGEKKGYEMYMEIASRENLDQKTQSVARIFAKEEENHIEIYHKLKRNAKGRNKIEIDFDIYDQSSKLVSEFSYLPTEKIQDVQTLLRFAFHFEKENLALVLRLQGLLVRNKKDINSTSYIILSKLIEEEKQHVKNIENFIK